MSEGNFYKNYYAPLGSLFCDGTILTEVLIPPSIGEDILPLVIDCILRHSGKIWQPPIFKSDGSIVLSPITFHDQTGMETCCKEIESNFEQILQQHTCSFNIKRLYIDFQAILEKIEPAIEFIEDHGGWCDNESFPGFDALEKAVAEGSSSELNNSFQSLAEFMFKYKIGEKAMDESTFKISQK